MPLTAEYLFGRLDEFCYTGERVDFESAKVIFDVVVNGHSKDTTTAENVHAKDGRQCTIDVRSKDTSIQQCDLPKTIRRQLNLMDWDIDNLEFYLYFFMHINVLSLVLWEDGDRSLNERNEMASYLLDGTDFLHMIVQVFSNLLRLDEKSGAEHMFRLTMNNIYMFLLVRKERNRDDLLKSKAMGFEELQYPEQDPEGLLTLLLSTASDMSSFVGVPMRKLNLLLLLVMEIAFDGTTSVKSTLCDDLVDYYAEKRQVEAANKQLESESEAKVDVVIETDTGKKGDEKDEKDPQNDNETKGKSRMTLSNPTSVDETYDFQSFCALLVQERNLKQKFTTHLPPPIQEALGIIQADKKRFLQAKTLTPKEILELQKNHYDVYKLWLDLNLPSPPGAAVSSTTAVTSTAAATSGVATGVSSTLGTAASSRSPPGTTAVSSTLVVAEKRATSATPLDMCTFIRDRFSQFCIYILRVLLTSCHHATSFSAGVDIFKESTVHNIPSQSLRQREVVGCCIARLLFLLLKSLSAQSTEDGLKNFQKAASGKIPSKTPVNLKNLHASGWAVPIASAAATQEGGKATTSSDMLHFVVDSICESNGLLVILKFLNQDFNVSEQSEWLLAHSRMSPFILEMKRIRELSRIFLQGEKPEATPMAASESGGAPTLNANVTGTASDTTSNKCAATACDSLSFRTRVNCALRAYKQSKMFKGPTWLASEKIKEDSKARAEKTSAFKKTVVQYVPSASPRKEEQVSEATTEEDVMSESCEDISTFMCGKKATAEDTSESKESGVAGQTSDSTTVEESNDSSTQSAESTELRESAKPSDESVHASEESAKDHTADESTEESTAASKEQQKDDSVEGSTKQESPEDFKDKSEESGGEKEPKSEGKSHEDTKSEGDTAHHSDNKSNNEKAESSDTALAADTSTTDHGCSASAVHSEETPSTAGENASTAAETDENGESASTIAENIEELSPAETAKVIDLDSIEVTPHSPFHYSFWSCACLLECLYLLCKDSPDRLRRVLVHYKAPFILKRFSALMPEPYLRLMKLQVRVMNRKWKTQNMPLISEIYAMPCGDDLEQHSKNAAAAILADSRDEGTKRAEDGSKDTAEGRNKTPGDSSKKLKQQSGTAEDGGMEGEGTLSRAKNASEIRPFLHPLYDDWLISEAAATGDEGLSSQDDEQGNGAGAELSIIAQAARDREGVYDALVKFGAASTVLNKSAFEQHLYLTAPDDDEDDEEIPTDESWYTYSTNFPQGAVADAFEHEIKLRKLRAKNNR